MYAFPGNMFHALQILGCRNEQTAASWLEEKQAGVRFTCATRPETDLVGSNRHCPFRPTVFQKTLHLSLSWRSRPVHLKEFRCLSVVMAVSINGGTMTDESEAMVKKVGLISLGGVILLAFSKMIFHLVGWVAAAMSPCMLCSRSRSWLLSWSTWC